MARYSLTSKGWSTGAGSADAATITASGCYLGGNSATMQLRINEVTVGGEASSASFQGVVLARDSTNAATPTAGTSRNNLMDATSTAPGTVAIFGQTATTLPTRAVTHLIEHPLQAYGGYLRWQARQGEEIVTITATAPNSEISYSLYTGSTAGTTCSSTIIYELT